MKLARQDSSCASILGPEAVEAMRRVGAFLLERPETELLAAVGRTFPNLALPPGLSNKRAFPASYGGGQPCDDDVLAGRGPFYVTEAGKLMLDAVSGHYQMTWGYNPPDLAAAAVEAMDLGLVWDNHANTPGLPVKLLAARLVSLARARLSSPRATRHPAGSYFTPESELRSRAAGDPGLDRVHLGVCTGSVATETALKIAVRRHSRDKAKAAGAPVMIVLKGNYHGTNLSTQALRGQWTEYVRGFDTVEVEPNDAAGLEGAFRRHGPRAAAFWAEPVMMNREAILVAPEFLRLGRRLCTEHGALMIVDEIQTGFWYPEVFLFRRAGIMPDVVVIGKGMTAGFHPLAGLLFRHELDILDQYDAINTNGQATLPALVSLASLDRIQREAAGLRRRAEAHERELAGLVRAFPDALESWNGSGFLTGLRFRRRETALAFHKAAVQRGLWLRAHAYHEGHRTVLMKLPLAFTDASLRFLHGALRDLLATVPTP